MKTPETILSPQEYCEREIHPHTKLESSKESIEKYETFLRAIKPKINTVYHPFCCTDINPAKAFAQSRVIHVDLEKDAIEALQKEGFEAYEASATEFDPGEVDLMILNNCGDNQDGQFNKPISHLIEGGFLLCNGYYRLQHDLKRHEDFTLIGVVNNKADRTPFFDQENLEDYFTEVENEEEMKLNEVYYKIARKYYEKLPEPKEPFFEEIRNTVNNAKQCNYFSMDPCLNFISQGLPRKKTCPGPLFVFQKKKTCGLDMKKTLKFYESQDIYLPKSEGQAEIEFTLENPEWIGLSEEEIQNLISLYPENARKRSILEKIIGMPNTWFHKDYLLSSTISETQEPEEAISPTAIIPSKIEYSNWPRANIKLFDLPKEVISEKTRKIIATQGFIHEFAHSIIAPVLWGQYRIQLKDGEILGNYELMIKFGNMAEKHPPMSQYSSTYRNPDNSFDPEKTAIGVNEELAECIAAYYLGFTYCKDEKRRLDPFYDRPEIKQFVEDFLNAEKIELPTI